MIALVLASSWGWGRAEACSCRDRPSASGAFEAADATFEGSVIEVSGGRVSLRLFRAWKGIADQTVEVVFEPNHPCNRWNPKVGEAHLVFATAQADGLHVGVCDRSGPTVSVGNSDHHELGEPELAWAGPDAARPPGRRSRLLDEARRRWPGARPINWTAARLGKQGQGKSTGLKVPNTGCYVALASFDPPTAPVPPRVELVDAASGTLGREPWDQSPLCVEAGRAVDLKWAALGDVAAPKHPEIWVTAGVFIVPAKSPKAAIVVPLISGLEHEPKYRDLVAVLGDPDSDVGSGIYIFVFKLDTGARLLVGTIDRDRVLYVDHHHDGDGADGRKRIFPRETEKEP